MSTTTTTIHNHPSLEDLFEEVMDAIQLAAQGRIGKIGRIKLSAICAHVSETSGVANDHNLYGELCIVMSRVKASGRAVYQAGRDGGWALTDQGRAHVGLPIPTNRSHVSPKEKKRST